MLCRRIKARTALCRPILRRDSPDLPARGAKHLERRYTLHFFVRFVTPGSTSSTTTVDYDHKDELGVALRSMTSAEATAQSTSSPNYSNLLRHTLGTLYATQKTAELASAINR